MDYDYDYDNDYEDRYVNDYESPEDAEFYEYMYNDTMSSTDKELFEQCLLLSKYCVESSSNNRAFDFPLEEMSARFPYTYNQIIRHVLTEPKPEQMHDIGILESLVKHINTKVDCTSMVEPLVCLAFRIGNRYIFDFVVEWISRSEENQRALFPYYRNHNKILVDMCQETAAAADKTQIQEARIHMYRVICATFCDDEPICGIFHWGIYVSALYVGCCTNKLYLIAEFIIELCQKHGADIPVPVLDDMFVWGCENREKALIDMYLRRDPYTYDIITIEKDEEQVKEKGDDNLYMCISKNRYGIVRTPKNAKWQRDRLLIQGLMHIPTDLVRVIHAFL